jgi:MinD-like ATPase involved in chromosome partitioning or flagellar assembly
MSAVCPGCLGSVDWLAGTVVVRSGDAMEQVSMNDGLDGRETVAFGLAAGEVAVFVLALMSAYAALRSGLPGAAACCLAALLAAGGGALAWGRLDGRPLLEWAVLLARFVVRTRHVHFARLAQACRGLRRRPRPTGTPVVARVALRRHPEQGATTAANGPPRLAVVGGPLREVGPGAEAGPDRGRRGHVVGFFSLNGGSGRTTLAVELATLLAVRARAGAASDGLRPRVALLDLTERSPTAALRLGIPLPLPSEPDDSASLVAHESGLLVLAAAAAERCGPASAATAVRAAVAAAERAGAGAVVVDVDCDLGVRCAEVLRHCDEVYVTVAPTAVGVLDAYRSTAALRRLGLRDRIGYIVNRWRAGVDLADVMADLGGTVSAAVPEDAALVRAENGHRPAVLDRSAAIAAALRPLAERVECATDGYRGAIALRAGGHAG